MGKSALGFEIARRVAGQGRRVLIFSLEMTRQQVVARWVAGLSGVPGDRMIRGLCPPEYAGTAMETRYLSTPELGNCYQALDQIAGLDGLAITDQASTRNEVIQSSIAASKRLSKTHKTLRVWENP